MKVYALIGKSGTGKSYQAVNLCKDMNIESIIDDGLFICRNKVVAGTSAKRQQTKVGAVKTALFHTEEHMKDVKAGIAKANPESILIIGTSEGMVTKIVTRLGLPPIEKHIYIEDITTEAERQTARKQRDEMGQHVIPAPTFQLKRQFSGYFMTPMKILRKEWDSLREASEKSVVRPTYSYLGEYKISENVMSDIIYGVRNELEAVEDIAKVAVFPLNEGIDIYVALNLRYGVNIVKSAETFQDIAAERIEEMTAFNVNRIDVEVRDIV